MLDAWEDAEVQRIWRRVIAASELGGAGLGAVVFSIEAATHPAGRTAGALLFCALSAVAGWRLLREKRGGLALSAAVQAVQVLWLWGPVAVYRVAAGPALIGSYTAADGADLVLGATAEFEPGLPHEAGVGAGINLFSVVALIGIARLNRVATRAAAGDGSSQHVSAR